MRKLKACAVPAAFLLVILVVVFLVSFIVWTYKKHPKSLDEIEAEHSAVFRAIDHIGEGKFKTAFSELEPVAEAGNELAMYYLACLYMSGQGVPQNYSKAMDLYIDSADMGLDQSQVMLSKIYSEGIVAKKDLIKAYTWASIAYSDENNISEVRGYAKKNMDLIAKGLSLAELKKAQAEASGWKKK